MRESRSPSPSETCTHGNVGNSEKSPSNAVSQARTRGALERRSGLPVQRVGVWIGGPATASGASAELEIELGRGVLLRPALLGAEGREEDHVADRVDAGDEHDQPVDADPEPAGRRQPVLERFDVLVVDRLGLLVAAGLEPRLRLEALRPGRRGR